MVIISKIFWGSQVKSLPECIVVIDCLKPLIKSWYISFGELIRTIDSPLLYGGLKCIITTMIYSVTMPCLTLL